MNYRAYFQNFKTETDGIVKYYGLTKVTNINNAIEEAKRSIDKPTAIIAKTIKGKGVSFIEGVKEWHHHTLCAEEYEQARKEVENV